MTHDKDLIERVARVLATSNIASIYKRGATPSEADHYWPSFCHDAQAAITAVRAYDAERRASVLDAAATNTGGVEWLTYTTASMKRVVCPDGIERHVSGLPTHDPDDYRDLPTALVEPVRFTGGLTEGPK